MASMKTVTIFPFFRFYYYTIFFLLDRLGWVCSSQDKQTEMRRRRRQNEK